MGSSHPALRGRSQKVFLSIAYMLKSSALFKGKDATSLARQLHLAAPRVALALGAAALPVGIFGTANASTPAILTASLALAAAVGMVAWTAVSRLNKKSAPSSCQLALAELVENMRDALVQFDVNGQVSLSTKSTRSLLGCEGYELSREGIFERVHILERPLFLTAFSKAQQEGNTQTIEVRMRRDTNTHAAVPEFFWVEVFLLPNRSADGAAAPFAVTATLRDVSEIRQVQSKMDEARQAAEEASLAKNRFLAVVGHELRTPLNAIVGFSDMMTNGIGGTLEPAHQEYASLISQSGHHLLEMVNMLLDMSKIEAGGFELQAEYFEPEKLVAPCVQMVTKSAAEKGVELDVELGRHLPEIRADERACRQILLNLLSNAIKFTQTGGRVTWSMKARGKKIAIRVTDTGIGMDERVLARLGEPFFQAQNSVDRGYEGTGLGISIVKGLVELHQGEIDVKSRLGEGTSVEILLPINGPETIVGDNDMVTNLAGENPTGSTKISQVQPDNQYKRTA